MLKATRKAWTWVPTLYFAQGLPYIAVMTLSVIMYKRLGLDNTSIALYTGWLNLPWVVKPLWSPVVDIFSTKRRWTLAMQLLLGLGFAAIAFTLTLPSSIQWSLAGFALLAFLSATHDISSDGFYMIALDSHEQSFFVGIRSTFYRIATITGQGALVILAGVMEESTGSVPAAWMTVFGALSAFFLMVTLWHSFALPLPRSDHEARSHKTLGDVLRAFGDTFAGFFRKPGIGVALLFILLYRLPEAQLIKLISPFLLDAKAQGGMGLTTAEVGVVYGTVGIIGLMLGGIAGGVLASRYGLKRCLLPMAWAMSLTCVVFLYLSYHPSTPLWLVNACVFVEQFGYGLGFTAFMLCLIYFSEGDNATTNYALCTGFMALGMMLPGMAAGALQEWLGYRGFFMWTMVCCVATIGVSMLIKVPAGFGKK